MRKQNSNFNEIKKHTSSFKQIETIKQIIKISGKVKIWYNCETDTSDT